MRTLAELYELSPPFGNPALPPPFADWTSFPDGGTPYAAPPWAPGLGDLGAPASAPAPAFSTGGILGPRLAARAAESNGFGGILGPVAGLFSSSPEPTGLTTPTGSDPLAMSFGQGQIPYGPAARNAFGAPPGLNFAVPPGLNQDINVPWSPQPVSSPDFGDPTAPQSARPSIGWKENLPPTYGPLGLSDFPSLGNGSAGRDPEAGYPWLPGAATLGKLGAYGDAGDPNPNNGAADRFANGPASLSPVISDAAEDRWIPGARYVQARGRRGGGRVGEREPSTAESVRFMIYNHNRAVMRELDPQNPLITTPFVSTRDWVPSAYDNDILRREVERLRYERGLGLEPHHNLAREFAKRFRNCGLEPEDYVTYLPSDVHRLLPNGLHTGPENWNAVWRKYFRDQGSREPSSEEILMQLMKMWESAPWLQR
jgi:hypothetical protein